MASALIPLGQAAARVGPTAIRSAFTALGKLAGRALSYFGLGSTAYQAATATRSGSYSGGSTLAGGTGTSASPTPIGTTGANGALVRVPTGSTGLPANKAGVPVTSPAKSPGNAVTRPNPTAVARAANTVKAVQAMPSSSLARYEELIRLQDAGAGTGIIPKAASAGIGSTLALGDYTTGTDWARIGLFIAAGAAAILAVRAVRRA